MPGTPEGARLAQETLIKKYGGIEGYKKFMASIGGRGGVSYDKRTSPPRGFAAHPELASEAGKKGGAISRRGKRNGKA